MQSINKNNNIKTNMPDFIMKIGVYLVLIPLKEPTTSTPLDRYSKSSIFGEPHRVILYAKRHG